MLDPHRSLDLRLRSLAREPLVSSLRAESWRTLSAKVKMTLNPNMPCDNFQDQTPDHTLGATPSFNRSAAGRNPATLAGEL